MLFASAQRDMTATTVALGHGHGPLEVTHEHKTKRPQLDRISEPHPLVRPLQAFPAEIAETLADIGSSRPTTPTSTRPLAPDTPTRCITPVPPRPPRRVYTPIPTPTPTSSLPSTPALHRSPSPSPSTSGDYSTISSARNSQVSLESDTILTPGRRPSDEDAHPFEEAYRFVSDLKMTGTFSVSPPQSIVCTTDDEMPGRAHTVWSSSPAPIGQHTPLPFAKDGSLPTLARAFTESSRSMSPSSSCSHSDSSPAPPSSSDHSYQSSYQSALSELSKPSIRVTESPRGVPRLSFIDGGENLLGPPLPFIARTDSTTTASTVTAGYDGLTHEDSPSPISRKRRLAALRNLVSNLDFGQPWSVIERPVHGEDEFYWQCDSERSSSERSPPPQLNRLSLGSLFDAGEVSELAGESVLSLPHMDATDARNSGTWPRSRRYSRSVGALIDSVTREPSISKPAKSRQRPAIPPRTSSRPVLTPSDMGAEQTPVLRLNIEPRASSIYRNGPTLRKSTSQRPMGTPRELPRPRQRKESFGVIYSGYSKSLRPTTPRPEDHAASWRQSLPNEHIYDSVAAGPDGVMEVKRQEIMWEMSETEAAFVRSCRDVIRLFASPLREAQGDWMKGLPAGVCELFEALEAIHKTHADISTAQQIAHRRSDVVDTVAFVEQFGAWVGRLAVHERYIMLFNTVVAQIEEAARDQSSIFGEFLRLQTRDKALGSLSLGSMLLKPVQRITKYTLFLRRLLAATPATHKGHASLVELIDSTESVIGHLEACKAREDDFLQLITLEERLDDLPGNFDLATRGRRLVGHAQIVRVGGEPRSASMPGMPRSVSVRSLKATMAAVPSFASIRAPSRGASTDSELHQPRGLTTSPSSGTSSIHSITGTASPGRLSRSPSYSSSLAENSRPPNLKMNSFNGFRKNRREEVVTLLVFNDMVALAVPVADKVIFKSRKGGEAPRLRILSVFEGGLGGVEDVRELEGSGNSRWFSLTVRSPDGLTYTSSYSMAPVTNVSRRTQRTLPGAGFDKVDQLVSAIQMTRSGNKEEEEEL